MIHTTSNKVKGTSASGKVYILGSKWIEGSKRIAFEEDSEHLSIEKLENGIWQPGSLNIGAETLWVGHNVGITGVGHHLAKESADGHLHFYAHTEFDQVTGLTLGDTRILDSYAYFADFPFQSDQSGEWTGTQFDHLRVSTVDALMHNAKFRIGNTAPSSPIRMQIFIGSDDTGIKVFDQWFPATNWIANTEHDLNFKGYIEFVLGQTYLVRYSSAEIFSLKTNVAVSEPYFLASFSAIKEDNLLQTAPWVDGASHTIGDQFIDGRKIHICNVTGVQLGTFAENSDKWDDIGGGIGNMIPLSQKGVADGVATLSSTGKVPISQLPTGTTVYKGTWNATTNTPTLADGTGTAGDAWLVTTAGTQDLGSGNITFAVNDQAIYNGTIWEKSVNEDHWTKSGTTLTPKISGDDLSIGGLEIMNGTMEIGSGYPIYWGDPSTSVNGSSVGGAEYIKLQTAGAVRLTVDGDGNVGIGSDTPSNKLTIKTGVANDGIYLVNGADATRGRLAINTNGDGFFTLTDRNGVESIVLASEPDFDNYFNNGGGVGIGTSDMSTELGDAVLKVKSSGSSINAIAVESSIGTDLLWIRESADGDGSIHMRDKTDTQTIQLTTDEADSYILNGNFGIGIDNPAYKLTVKTGVTNDGIRLLNASDALRIRLAINNLDDGYLGIRDRNEDETILFASEANFDSYINTGGNFGIGMRLPQAKLDVDGHINATTISAGNNISDYKLALWDGSDQPHIFLGYNISNSATIGLESTGVLRIVPTGTAPGVHIDVGGDGFFNVNDFAYYDAAKGSLGINTTNPDTDYVLDVNGDTNITGELTVSNVINLTGGQRVDIKGIATNYNATYNDYIILVDTTSGNIAITLPSNPTDGQVFIVKRVIGDNQCSVHRNGNNIDGIALDRNLVLNQSETFCFMTGYGWTII